MRDPVVVIGGGLAGLAAALRLADAGRAPVLLETRRQLGGRATSFVDKRTGRVVDNCQHVLVGCCTNLIDFYDRIGVADLIEWHRTLYFTAGHGIIEPLRAGMAPAPFHLGPSMARMSVFDRGTRRHVQRAMWRLIRGGRSERLRWRDRTFAEYLLEVGQPPEVIDRFWNTVIVSACNVPVDRVAGDVAMQVFQEGFLANRWSYTMGLPSVPLADLYDPAASAIESAGGIVRLGVTAEGLNFDGARLRGVVTSDGLVPASAVVVALPFDRVARLATDALRERDLRLQMLDRFEVSPILAVHLVYPSPVMEQPHLVLVDHDIDWLFDKGTSADGEQHIHAVKSAAVEWMDLDEAEIVRRTRADIESVLPAARGIEPRSTRAIKERRATFAATPEIAECRPSAARGVIGVGGGGVENLYLAGDWCDTGWPATMEGAVRSGYAAAAAITGTGGIVDDVPSGMLARWLGLR